jgi:hypothetical protein
MGLASSAAWAASSVLKIERKALGTGLMGSYCLLGFILEFRCGHSIMYRQRIQ